MEKYSVNVLIIDNITFFNALMEHADQLGVSISTVADVLIIKLVLVPLSHETDVGQWDKCFR